MEDNRVFVQGFGDKTICLPLKDVTHLAATTDEYALLPPLRDRDKDILLLAKASERFQQICSELERADQVAVSRLSTASSALLLAHLFNEVNRPFLVVTESIDDEQMV